MVYPREVLNRLRWQEGEDLSEATIWFVHRGAPGGVANVSGSDVVSLGRSFMEVEGAFIPYHRVTRIEYRGKVVFDKEVERHKGAVKEDGTTE
ncbi:MAG: DUF504 domain-containing protein [Methanobacteriota archaeon]|nr:MAG: DUF504 domain-containing protein [Euryarchaeota archaeon]